MPRFETESATNDLIGTLKTMGIHSAFDNAEIPNMCDKNFYISMMLQKAIIKVNETGTEAAAVTVAGILLQCLPLPPKNAVFYADHPFVYVIREKSSGVILFVGKFTGV